MPGLPGASESPMLFMYKFRDGLALSLKMEAIFLVVLETEVKKGFTFTLKCVLALVAGEVSPTFW